MLTGDFPGEHVVEHHAHGIEIGAAIHRGAFDQHFGGYIIRRAHRRAFLRGGGVQHAGQAEIRHLHRALHIDQDVRRLDVPMHHPALMRVAQRIADMRGDGQCMLRRQPLLRVDHFENVRAIDVLHHDVQQPVARLAKVVHGHDRSVVQPCHRARLIFKARHVFCFILRHLGRQHLDGHRSVQ